MRRNLPVILEDYRGSMLPDDLLILSGQALYRMVRSPAWADLSPFATAAPSLFSEGSVPARMLGACASDSYCDSCDADVCRHVSLVNAAVINVLGSMSRVLMTVAITLDLQSTVFWLTWRSLNVLQDYGALLRTHREYDADITIATHAVGRKQASLRGITRVDPDSGARACSGRRSQPSGSTCVGQYVDFPNIGDCALHCMVAVSQRDMHTQTPPAQAH